MLLCKFLLVFVILGQVVLMIALFRGYLFERYAFHGVIRTDDLFERGLSLLRKNTHKDRRILKDLKSQ